MISAALPQSMPAQAPGPSALPEPALSAIRAVAARSRLEPRSDIEATCQLLRSDPGQAAEAYARAFLRAAAHAIGKPLRFHRPGVAAVTFDEAWVTRLLGSLRCGDLDSALFCIGSRVPRARRASVRFLAGALAERLDALCLEPL